MSTNPERRPMLSVDELAEWLSVPRATVYAWQHKGTGPRALKVGRHLRFRPADVEQWLDTQS